MPSSGPVTAITGKGVWAPVSGLFQFLDVTPVTTRFNGFCYLWGMKKSRPLSVSARPRHPVASVLQLSYISGMTKTAMIQARIEPETKRKAEAVLKHLGLSSTDAIRLFYRQIVLRKGLPFAVAVPNETTAKTLRKSRAGKDTQEFATLDALFESWER